MGQQSSLNCAKDPPEKEKEVETTQSNIMNLARALNSPSQQIQLSTKKASTFLAATFNKDPQRIDKAPLKPKKTMKTFIPSHQYLLRVQHTQFQSSYQLGSKWVQRRGKCLADVIESIFNTTQYFPKPQIVALIQSLVYSLAYLQKEGIKHNDFYPTNIFYCLDSFKLTNPLYIQQSAYVLTQQRKRFSFLPPELIANIVQGQPEYDIPPQIMYKSDIFAIGMILLQCATLQPSFECYNSQNCQLIDHIIKERILKVSQLYSPTIADCIAQMLVYNVEDRISVQDLAKLVHSKIEAEKNEEHNPEKIIKQDKRPSNKLQPIAKPNILLLHHHQKAPQKMIDPAREGVFFSDQLHPLLSQPKLAQTVIQSMPQSVLQDDLASTVKQQTDKDYIPLLFQRLPQMRQVESNYDQDNYQDYYESQPSVSQEDLDLLYTATFKQLHQLSAQYEAANKQEGTSFACKNNNTQAHNEYPRERYQSFCQRVDRILQITRNFK